MTRLTRQEPSGSPGARGAAVCPLERVEGTYRSAALGRDQPFICLAPCDAAPGRTTYPLVVLLHGRGGAYTDWTRYTRLERYAAVSPAVFVCPDGGDGWYTNAPGGERREDDIIGDLVPAIEARFPLLPAPSRAIWGLSMGGYGAVKLALKHPGAFGVAVSHSGAFDITTREEGHSVFGDPVENSSHRRSENPAWLAEQALCSLASERPRLWLDCGLSDPLIEANRRFSSHLDYIGYGHTYREMPGHHTWPYWDRAFRTILPEVLSAMTPVSMPPPH